MNSTQSFHKQIDAARLPEGQVAWVAALVSRVMERLGRLSADERALFTQLCRLIARSGSPVTSHHLVDLKLHPDRIRDLMADLDRYKLVWFDDDLRAVLRCPPLSVLHTPHQVKAFGWERSYASSLIEAPVTLIVFGPNVWLTVQTTCPHSGELLKFRVMLTDSERLRLDAPGDADQWRVWLPVPAAPLADAYDWLHENRLRIGLFHSQEDLDAYRRHEGGDPGIVYTLEQAVYLSQWLLYAYRRALGQ